MADIAIVAFILLGALIGFRKGFVVPLAAGARYHVRLELSVAGTDVVDEWEFDTER